MRHLHTISSALLTCVLLCVGVDRAAATEFWVDSLDDTVDVHPGNGVCADINGNSTLRAAIMEANAWPGDDIIHLPVGRYVLSIPGEGEDGCTEGDLDITSNLEIRGEDQSGTIVDADQIDRVVHVMGTINVTLSDLTIRNGLADTGGYGDFGGGIYVQDDATVVITDCTITANSAAGPGGGVYELAASLTLTGCTFSGNSAIHGGGMSGGGTLVNCTFSENSAVIDGGGMLGVGTLTGCTFSENNAGNSGGGRFGGGTVTNCTFSGNSASNNGGGMHGRGTLTNCTFSGNSAVHDGGGLRVSQFDSADLTNCTFSGNSASNDGGGIYVYSGGSVNLTNCILWDDGNEIDGDTTNLSVTFSCIGGGWTGEGNIADDPLLGPLADNGGPTLTHALLPDSPAIDSGDPNPAACPPTDQRGVPRPQEGDGEDVAVCDMGAFEFFPDCNGNDINDYVDLDDCDGSPWCSDCNGNGVLDECDITEGTSEDYNGDGVPDDCQALYVKADATGDNNGTSWEDAFIEPQSALDQAQPGAMIWVAAGTYLPDFNGLPPHTGIRTASFQLVSGVEIYGGFAGGETRRAQRDPATNITILSGDLLGNDDPDALPQLTDGSRADNSLNVVVADGTLETAILDGFTIASGHANTSGYATVGAGVRCRNGSPTLRNCILKHNLAKYDGGAVYVEQSTPTIRDCSFIENVAANDVGGGMYGTVAAAPLVVRSTFRGNWGIYGGAVADANACEPQMINCRIVENHSQGGGGGIYSANNCLPELTNCLLMGNVAGESGGANGGGMYNGGASHATLVNCTIAYNQTSGVGAGIADENISESSVAGCILWANQGVGTVEENQIHLTNGTPSALYSCIQDDDPNDGSIPFGGAGNFNIDDDPLFVSVEDENLGLMAGSPCRDVGSYTLLSADDGDLDENGNTEEKVPFDLAGNTRVVDDPQAPDGPDGVVDMGAYEYQYLGCCSCPGDLAPGQPACDNFVNVTDFTRFASAYGTSLGDPGYNFCADLAPAANPNGVVNVTDFTLFAAQYGQPCP